MPGNYSKNVNGLIFNTTLLGYYAVSMGNSLLLWD
jgi:hypothetical protein